MSSLGWQCALCMFLVKTACELSSLYRCFCGCTVALGDFMGFCWCHQCLGYSQATWCWFNKKKQVQWLTMVPITLLLWTKLRDIFSQIHGFSDWKLIRLTRQFVTSPFSWNRISHRFVKKIKDDQLGRIFCPPEGADELPACPAFSVEFIHPFDHLLETTQLPRFFWRIDQGFFQCPSSEPQKSQISLFFYWLSRTIQPIKKFLSKLVSDYIVHSIIKVSLITAYFPWTILILLKFPIKIHGFSAYFPWNIGLFLWFSVGLFLVL